MARKLLSFLFLAGLFIGLVSPIFALERVTLGSAVKMSAIFYLPVLAAEEKGFWKENGLDVEWVPFASGTPLMRAVAAGVINIGMHASSGPGEAAERGLPVVMVAELIRSSPFILWVRTASPYRHVQDLKGKRIGVMALGTASHAFAQIIVKAHGVEQDVRFVGAGGIPQTMAGLKVGAFEAIVVPLTSVPGPKVEGAIRELASAANYLPKPWIDHVIFARKEFARGNPEIVRRTIKAALQAVDFVKKNPRWALDKMKSFQGLSEEAAKAVYESIEFTTSGRLDRKAIENLRNFFIEYGILTKEKAPAVDDLFINEYVP